jgi:hypothetical protein
MTEANKVSDLIARLQSRADSLNNDDSFALYPDEIAKDYIEAANQLEAYQRAATLLLRVIDDAGGFGDVPAVMEARTLIKQGGR